MKGKAGYSLFEVMIAFVIMTLVLAALIPGQARLLGRATVQKEQLLAYDYALSRLATLGTAGPLSVGTTQDVYRDWRISTTTTPGLAIRTETPTVTIVVTVDDLSGRRLATAETLRITP